MIKTKKIKKYNCEEMKNLYHNMDYGEMVKFNEFLMLENLSMEND